jgi:hypothetical protein
MPRFSRIARRPVAFVVCILLLALIGYTVNETIGRHQPVVLPLSSAVGYELWSLWHRILPLAFIITTSLFLAWRMGVVKRIAVLVVAIGGFAALNFWVPNPTVYWPTEWLGDRTLPEMARETLTYCLIRPPNVTLSSQAAFEAEIRWQFSEEAARFWVVFVAWCICLAILWSVGRRSNQSLELTAERR